LVVIDKEEDRVRLIHYTTQMYFQLAHVQASLFCRAQSEITLACITYMTLICQAFSNVPPVRERWPPSTRHPFLDYTVGYCLVHARGEPETVIRDSILSFLANCSIRWRLWKQCGGRGSAPNRLRIALAFRLQVICRCIISEDLAEDGASDLLQEAVSEGDINSVGILVENGVNANNQGDVLRQAAILSCGDILDLLLRHFSKNPSRQMN
jgi:hypothetical protein